MNLTEKQKELISKIKDAEFTAEELQRIIDKAQELLKERQLTVN